MTDLLTALKITQYGLDKFSKRDLITVFRIARLGLAMVQDEIADELGLPDGEMIRLREEVIYPFLEGDH